MSASQPDGYLALPASGAGALVLVLHPWWGLNATIRAFCDRLAAAGFVAFAPDLYHGDVTDKIDEAEQLAGSIFDNLDQYSGEVAASADYLLERTGARTLSVVGFSLGAFFALLLATQPDPVRKVVAFYGTGPDDFSQSQAAFLGHFAETDPFEPSENVVALEAALTQAGRPAALHTYPGTGHWFFEPDRADAYNADAAALAWERTLAFLKDE